MSKVIIATYTKPKDAFEALEFFKDAVLKIPSLKTVATYRVSVSGHVQTWGGDSIILTGDEPTEPCEAEDSGWWVNVITEGTRKTVAPAHVLFDLVAIIAESEEE